MCEDRRLTQDPPDPSVYVPPHLQNMGEPTSMDVAPKGIRNSDLPTWEGPHNGTLADHYQKIRDTCYTVPELGRHLSFLIYASLKGRARLVIDRENQRLRTLDMKPLQNFGMDDPEAVGIQLQLLKAFPEQPTFDYLLKLRQFTMSYWRDSRGGSQETLPAFHQRLIDLDRDAQADLKDVPLFTALQLRLIYVAGLPTELQAYVVADPKQTWYQMKDPRKALFI